ncbi:MAG: DUF2723 domain-containing protein [Nitrososphaerales archaeon]
MRRFKGDAPAAAALGLVSFILYAATTAPSVATVFDDSLEFQVVLPILGIAHPSGYPLYTLLGKAVSVLLPIRDAAGRVNLLSAFFAAAAVVTLFLVARRFAGSRPAALVSAAVFALSPAWWSQATIAEVYALHALFVGVFLYCLLRWEEAMLMAGTAGRGRADRWLWVAALTCGLGLAHHRMIALLLPAAFIFIFWTDPGLLRRPRRWVAPVALGLAPLLLYLYLPIRGQVISSLDGTYHPTLQGTVDWITARGYGIFLTGNPFNIHRGWNDYLGIFLQEVGFVTLIVALLGLVNAFAFRGRRAVFLLVATLTQVAFGVAYKVQDVEVFFIPAFMLVCIWAAIGLGMVFDAAEHAASQNGWAVRLPRRFRPVLRLAWWLPFAAIMLFGPVSDALQDWPQRNRSDDWQAYDGGLQMVEAAAPGGRIVGLGGEVTLVRYFRDVLGQRPDLEVTRADAEAERYAAVDAALRQGQPVYLTRDLQGVSQRYSLDAAGPLIRVSPKAQPGPPPAGGQALGDLVLLDASLRPLPAHDPAARVTLRWTAPQPVAEELKVSARLLNGAGEVVAKEDATPVHFVYPTTAWVPGEEVEDNYDLQLPAGAAPGEHSALVILYRAADGSEVGRTTLGPALLQ